MGGEVGQITKMIHEGRLEAYKRMASGKPPNAAGWESPG